ncbi:MAG: hypothetical protein N2C13_03465, partial [Chloroflexota bacterium]
MRWPIHLETIEIMMKKALILLIGLIISMAMFAILLRFQNLPWLLSGERELTQTLFEGVTYEKEVRSVPRDMVIHVVTVDLKVNGIKTLVTPGSEGEDLPLNAQTTSDFLEKYNLQLAINGDAFYPWFVFWPFYGPHRGDAVNVFGYAASKGTAYSEGIGGLPTLYINQINKASINS